MFLLPIFAVLIVLILSGIRVAQEYERAIVFRLGRYNSVKGPGIYYLIPVIDRQQKVDTRTRTVNLEQQETITKDSVTIKVNAVLWFRIIEPSAAILKVANYEQAVYQFSVTALRNIIGQNLLDEVLKEREAINQKMQKMVDTVTEPWGIKIEMVEMKDVAAKVRPSRRARMKSNRSPTIRMTTFLKARAGRVSPASGRRFIPWPSGSRRMVGPW